MDASTRDHVRRQARPSIPASASASDAESEKYPDVNQDNDIIRDKKFGAPVVPLSRKEKRTLKKQGKRQDVLTTVNIPDSPELVPGLAHLSLGPVDTPAVSDADLDSAGEDEEESPQISRNEQKRRLKKKRREEQKGKQRQQRAQLTDTTTLPDTPPTSPKGLHPLNSPPTGDKSTLSTTSLSLPPSISAKMPPPSAYHPLLVCSIGNPGTQYASTLHSAGHTILSIIRERGLYEPFYSGLSGKVARPDTTTFKFSLTGYSKEHGARLAPGEDDFTLWQSTKLMNVSGPSVATAWRQFAGQSRFQAEGQTPRLVVVHDELESPLGKVSIKDGASSPRGHNGLKSVQASLAGRVKWWRVGVGIGRPESRDPTVVSKYVLRKMTDREERAMETASLGVLEALRKIAEGKA